MIRLIIGGVTLGIIGYALCEDECDIFPSKSTRKSSTNDEYSEIKMLEEEKKTEETLKPIDNAVMMAHRIGERYKTEETGNIVWINDYIQISPFPSITFKLSDDQDSPV